MLGPRPGEGARLHEDAASLALVGGRVRTLDAHGTIAEAMLIEHGRSAAVGTQRRRATRWRRDAVEVIDLDGRTVLPGMIDAHTHVELSTLADRFWVVVRELDVATILERMRAAAGAAPEGAWIVGQGTFGQPMPMRRELDEAAPRHPVVLRQSMHRQVASTLRSGTGGHRPPLRRAARVPRRARRARRRRRASSRRASTSSRCRDRPSRPLARALALEVADRWVRHGVTTIHELPASTTGTRAWQALHGPARCRAGSSSTRSSRPGTRRRSSSVESFARLGLMTGFGDEWLRFGSLKLFLDGAGCAGLHHAQLAGPARGWGLQNFLYDELVRILAECRDARVQVWMHAVGDAAHTLAIDAVEEVNVARGGERPPHADRAHPARHGGLRASSAAPRRPGIIPVPTAAFMHFEPDDRETVLRPRGRLFPYRTLIASGLLPPGNSDTAGTQPFATNPWHGVALMQLRRNRNGVAVRARRGRRHAGRRAHLHAERRLRRLRGAPQGLARGRQARRRRRLLRRPLRPRCRGRSPTSRPT